MTDIQPDYTPFLGLPRPDTHDDVDGTINKLRDAMDALDAWAQGVGTGGGAGFNDAVQYIDLSAVVLNVAPDESLQFNSISTDPSVSQSTGQITVADPYSPTGFAFNGPDPVVLNDEYTVQAGPTNFGIAITKAGLYQVFAQGSWWVNDAGDTGDTSVGARMIGAEVDHSMPWPNYEFEHLRYAVDPGVTTNGSVTQTWLIPIAAQMVIPDAPPTMWFCGAHSSNGPLSFSLSVDILRVL